MRLTPRRQAWFWGSVGVITLGLSLWKGWLVIHLWGFGFPLGVLALVYGGLQLVVHLMTRGHVRLGDDELERWGGALEEATPRILELLEEGRSVQAVAREIESAQGIPPDITNRYIIDLLAMLRSERRDLLVPRDEEGGQAEPPRESDG